MMSRFIHSSDLHFGKHFGDLPERLREAPRQTIGKLADHARKLGVTTVLLAGDTFDTETPGGDVRR
ncbi:hypothetical protein [Mesorhizobium sp. 1B3]|uniref:hypothetical protein n=1 Tax=Mesorhizobium sp. 1B3 TaxID=3243599 RepID=UPI003D98BF4D